jgi:hypothetical protein
LQAKEDRQGKQAPGGFDGFPEINNAGLLDLFDGVIRAAA